MKVHFYSISSSGRVDFETTADHLEDKIKFKDLSQNDTNIEIAFLDEHIHFIRTGEVESLMPFHLNEKTKGYYKNNLGLSFELEVFTKRISKEKSKISIEYDFFIDGEHQDTVKIYLLMK